jgi:zinc transport system ATP-binding protein
LAPCPGGQFQRLLVTFALVGGPNVLLLDEPTASVDEPGQEQYATAVL